MALHSSGRRRASRLPRCADAVLAALLVSVLVPIGLAIALVLACRGGPVWFVQHRLGRDGRPFGLRKFATHDGAGGALVTVTGDDRVHAFGRWLRWLRLDELPQLLNVLRGDMALVGPRPEVPANLGAVAAEDLGAVQCVRPGLTGASQLGYAAEDEVLAAYQDPVPVYRRCLVPWKVRLDRRLLARRTWFGDLRILLLTPILLVAPRARRRSLARVRRRLRCVSVGISRKQLSKISLGYLCRSSRRRI